MAQTVGQHGVAAFTSPVNGDPLNATVVVANDNATRGAYVDHDSDPDIHVQSSLLASRPAAGTAGRKWMTTDSGAVKLWFDTGSAWSEIAYLPSAGGTVAGNVSITGTLGVTGVLTATGGVVGAVTGNASTATALQTARAINGVNFDGTAAITVTAAAGTLTGATLASNVLASSLTSVGTLAGLTVTAPITGSVTGSSGSTTGNAATATALQTGRAINGVTFDGTAPITVTAAAGTLSGATLASGVTASSLTSVGTLTGLTVTNPIVGSVTGSSGSTTGNAATATALQTARTINGTSFDGTANVTVTAAAGTLTGATLASGVTASSLTSVGTLGSLIVTNPITGSVTGSSGSTTGNAATATALQTARAINGTNFDGTAAITVTAAAGTLTGATLASNVLASSLTSVGTLAGLTVTAPITGSVTGSSGSTTGNAATATALQTSRNINGTAFNGTADITVTAAAGTLTGATLASGVTASSLTSVGTLSSLAVTGNLTVDTNTLFVDAVNNRVGVGTASPSYTFDVVGSSATALNLAAFSNTSSANNTTKTVSAVFRLSDTVGVAKDTAYITAFPDGANVLTGGLAFSTRTGDTTPTEKMRLDSSGNLGLGVTPSATWASTSRAFQFKSFSALFESVSGKTILSFNAIETATNTFNYSQTEFATMYQQVSGVHSWFTAPSGTAGNAITFTQAMTLDASGKLGIGTASPAATLHVDASGGGVLRVTRLSASASAYAQIENDGTNSTINSTGVLVFGTGSTPAERARIDASGNFQLGTTTNKTTSFTGNGTGMTIGADLAPTIALWDTSNASYVSSMTQIGPDLYLTNTATGVITFSSNNTERARIPSVGGFVVGTAALTTAATDGFLYVPTCAGTPTGAPSAQPGTAAIVINTTNNKLYFYSGGAWRDAGP